jgi:hypothetical protein
MELLLRTREKGVDPVILRVRDHERENVLNTLHRALGLYTVPMSRAERRRGAPLVEPVSSPDAARLRREHEISHAAARTGGRWGAAAGLVSGVVGAVATAALSGQ